MAPEEHGKLSYRSIDGAVTCQPGNDNWVPADVIKNGSVLDLMNMRAQMIVALRKIEDELDTRGLMDRLT